jgi:glycine betaine/proline transport system substrate-binding protein
MNKKLKYATLFTICVGIVTGLIVLSISYSHAQEKKPIKIAWMAWTENEAMMGTAKAVLEDKMGYPVEDIFLDFGVAMESLATGKVDVLFELSVPNYHLNYWKEMANKIFIAGSCYPWAKPGLYIPNYIPKEMVNSIEDLKKPGIREKFGGKIIGIDPGSGTNQITERTIKGYGLDYELVAGSEAGSLAILQKAVSKKDWTIHALWTPHYIWDIVDARPLLDPKVIMGFPDFATTAVRIDFMKHHSTEVGEFFSRFHLPLKDIHMLMAWIAKEKMSPEEAGRRYVKENPNRVHYWITGEIKE